MGMLALGTWWLVRNAPAPPQRCVAVCNCTRPARLFMKNFAVKSFDATGRLQSEVMGETGAPLPRHRHAGDRPGPHALGDAQRVRLTLATRRPRLEQRRWLRGAAVSATPVVTREPHQRVATGFWPQPRLEFRGEFLHAFTQEERCGPTSPVQLTRGNDRFTADTMEYDNLDQVLQLRGRVRGVLMPTHAKITAPSAQPLPP
jgi:lipopolysaccharide export system protein LptC